MASNLRTNFKDWIPDANGLLYTIAAVLGGKSSITDVSNYTQRGDEWTASILNDTNIEVNRLSLLVEQMIHRLDNTPNPVTGAMEPYEQSLLSLYNLHRTDGLTADEYAALSLTADQYTLADMTARQYAEEGKTILGGL